MCACSAAEGHELAIAEFVHKSKRERVNTKAGVPTDFVPYDRPKR
jgi:hypothetical protein